MKTDNELDNLIAHILDKLNRVEANVIDMKGDTQTLKDAIDEAILKLVAATTNLKPPYA